MNKSAVIILALILLVSNVAWWVIYEDIKISLYFTAEHLEYEKQVTNEMSDVVIDLAQELNRDQVYTYIKGRDESVTTDSLGCIWSGVLVLDFHGGERLHGVKIRDRYSSEEPLCEGE